MGVNKDDIVYHYCSVDAFLNIIQNSRLWLSDILKSNDNKECTWIKDMINSEIESRLAEIDSNALKAWKFGYQLRADIGNDMTVYTCCFSECYDSLSQWRGYAQDGQGVAIGFSKMHLQALNGKLPYHFIFNKVVYEEKEQEKFIDNIVKENFENMQFKGIGHVGLELGSNYLLRFPLYKNPNFNEEKEWRIVFLSRPGSKRINGDVEGFQFLDTKFRSGDGKIVSYLEMDFSNIKHKFVKEICIGPKSKVSKIDVQNVLLASGYYDMGKTYDYNEPIHITTSKSSYR
ncbi:MAG TPA: DUF2971 domain-containing protein [Clostridia bacterium]